jgi:hypothetical protein
MTSHRKAAGAEILATEKAGTAGERNSGTCCTNTAMPRHPGGRSTLIGTDDGDDAEFPQVAMSLSGNAVVVWTQYDGRLSHIWANQYTSGRGWSWAQPIETETEYTAFDSRVAVDPAGNALALWVQSDGTHYRVWANRYDAVRAWGKAQVIDAENAGAAYSPWLAMDPAGNGLAVWHQFDGARYRIWANT